MKIYKGIGLFLICLLFLSVYTNSSFTVGDNSVTIYKYVNNEIHLINQKPTKDNQKVAGSIYTLFKLNVEDEKVPMDDKDAVDKILDELTLLSIKELDERYPNPITAKPTDEEGMTTVDGLDDGRYYLVETIDEGEMLRISPYSVPLIFDLPLNKTDKDITIYPKSFIPEEPSEEPTTGGEKIIKIDGYTEEPLARAQFQLFDKDKNKYKVDGKLVFSTSNKYGEAIFKDLPYGKYYVKETMAPTGYIGTNEYFEINITATSLNDTVVKKVKNLPVEPHKQTTTTRGGTTSTGGITGGHTPSNDFKNFTGSIPKTGDIQIYLYAIAGLALIILGSILYKSEKHV